MANVLFETAKVKAKELGGTAFESGMKRAPYMDNEMLGLIDGKSSEESVVLIKAWITAWDDKARANERTGIRRAYAA